MLWFTGKQRKTGKKARLSIEMLVVFIAAIFTCFVVVFFVLTPMLTKESRDVSQTSKNAAERAGNNALKVNEIYVEDGIDSTYGSIDYWYTQIKLAPGSEWISLKNVVPIITIQNETPQEYQFNKFINCSIKDATTNLSIYNESNAHAFGFMYELRTRNPEAIESTIMTGDLGVICFKTPRSISNDETVDFKLIPKNGVVFSLEQQLPENLNTQRITIFERK